MSDFHLKFYQCHGCNGFGKHEDMVIWDWLNRGFCTTECKTEHDRTVFGYTPHRVRVDGKVRMTLANVE